MCRFCTANCSLGEDQTSWCGIRTNRAGKFITESSRSQGYLSYYLDPHVTNCCNATFCPASTGVGYPTYALHKTGEIGYYNLALFLYGCSFNCLFCQNWSHKLVQKSKLVTKTELVDFTLNNKRITCWCWFGGSIEPQFPFVISSTRQILSSKPKDRLIRICVEWNGDGNPKHVETLTKLIHGSGGNIKFDFKAWHLNLHYALTGRSNKQVLENIRFVAEYERKNPRKVPLLGISTLLVPYYVDYEEVDHIASFLADINPKIPYSLLAFHPDFSMRDLPITPKRQVYLAYETAKKHLENVRIGNLHLLGYYSLSDFLRGF